jgi:hypothetical protein
MTFQAAFYRGTHAGAPGIYNRLVRWWTRSPYSHVELIFRDGGPAQPSRAASSSFMDGGVRFKEIEFDPALWDLVALPDHLAASARTWFDVHEGDAYDLLGNVHFVLAPIGDDKRKWFCSEAVAAALGMPEPARFDPGTLYAALSFFNQPANAGFFTSSAKGNQ